MAIGSPQWMYASGEDFTIDQSLKVDGASRQPYLSFTPATNGTSQYKFTVAFWFKRGSNNAHGGTGIYHPLFAIANTTIVLNDDKLHGNLRGTVSGNYFWNTDALFRDPSAWYHIVAAWDSTQSTNTNRFKFYVNGVQQTFSSIDYMPQNRVLKDTTTHYIGNDGSSSYHPQCYFADYYMIDGQQLTPSDFGETGDYGEWKPKEYSGTYGTNGFYLPFKQDYTVEGFSTTLHKGTNASQYIGGAGFKPDLVWSKSRTNANGHTLTDSVRGTTFRLNPDSTLADLSDEHGLTALTSDGFVVDTGNAINQSGQNYVNWNWDMGADTPTGFSAVTWKGDGTNNRALTGFGFEPDLFWVKASDTNQGNHHIYDSVRGITKRLVVNGTQTEGTGYINASHPDGVLLGTNQTVNSSSYNYVAWGWDMGNTTATNTSGSISSQVRANTTYGQSIITYTGTGSNATIGHGLSSAPELVIVKDRSNANTWQVFHTSLGNTAAAFLDLSSAADTGETSYWNNTSPTNSLVTLGTNTKVNHSGHTYVAYAFHSVSNYSKFGSYSGNGSSTGPSVTLGFRPAWLMIKRTEGAGDWKIFDSTRNPLNEVTKFLHPNDASAEGTSSSYKVDFDDNGFQIKGSGAGINNNGETFIYMAFAGGMDSISDYNTDGSIPSRVKANPTYGQSIVSYTGTGSATTVGHGLDSAPEMVVVKSRDAAENWVVFHTNINSGQGYIKLNSTDAAITGSSRRFRFGNDSDGVVPDSTKVYIGSGGEVNTSGNDYIAYCFHSVTGYSKFGSYTGTGSSGNAITTGFKPAFVMVKRTDSANSWCMYDSLRDDYLLLADASDAEVSVNHLDFTDTGFTIQSTGGGQNTSGGTYIYMAFADKREYAYWLDQSGNNNDWTSNNLTESDISVDSPTNNFATWNPLDKDSNITLYEGNTRAYSTNSGGYACTSTISTDSGKWYAEINSLELPASARVFVGWALENYDDSTSALDDFIVHNLGSYERYVALGSNYDSSSTSFAAGDILQLAWDMDAGKFWFGKNGNWVNSGNPSSGTNATVTSSSVDSVRVVYRVDAGAGTTGNVVVNFGQDSSFAGNKTAQGNQDSNDIGDFYYEPPSGFLALCTDNLPEPAVVPSEHFNTVLWSGNGASSHAITGVGFQSDMLWLKERTSTSSNQIHDAIRSAGTALFTNATSAESSSSTYLQSFDTDGFTVGSSGSVNSSGDTYVAWNWKANGSGSSNSNGDITSTVSANTDAGFSIVSYTGNGSATQTVGHGLTKAPEVVIVKRRDSAQHWIVYHASNTTAPETEALLLSATDATYDHDGYWDDTAPTSSVFTIDTFHDVNASSGTYIAYCFHSVDGYSKFGSYTGNGDDDGTFIYTGFRPAFVMTKKTSSTSNWTIIDSTRSEYNDPDDNLQANTSVAEFENTRYDILSNGFKMRRGASGDTNTSGATYIYIAFAETPFKYSNGR